MTPIQTILCMQFWDVWKSFESIWAHTLDTFDDQTIANFLINACTVQQLLMMMHDIHDDYDDDDDDDCYDDGDN